MTGVRPAERKDAEAWLRMRRALWPEGSEREHRKEIEQFFAGLSREPLAVLVAFDSRGGGGIGFAELFIRPCAEGCQTDRVAYLEGWFVEEDERRRGVGRALLGAAEAWARARGCTEFASDSQPANAVSASAHRALGFDEVGTLVCYRKQL